MAEQEPDAKQEPEAEPDKQTDLDSMVSAAVAKAAAAIEEKYKSNIAGLDRKNTELTKELESEKTAHMNDKEKAEYERKKFQEDLDKRERALSEKQWDIDAADTLSAASLSVELKQLMQRPKDRESMEAWIEAFTSYEAKRDKVLRNEILIGNGGPKPKSGEPPTGIDPSDMDWNKFRSKYASHAEALDAWLKLVDH